LGGRVGRPLVMGTSSGGWGQDVRDDDTPLVAQGRQSGTMLAGFFSRAPGRVGCQLAASCAGKNYPDGAVGRGNMRAKFALDDRYETTGSPSGVRIVIAMT